MTDQTRVGRPFRDGLLTLDPLALLGSRCTSCATTSFPARSTCPNCRRTDEHEQVVLSDRGTVYSYTIVRQAPPGVEVPYVLAYVDLPEGVRLMTQLDREHIDEVDIGTSVRLARRPMGEADDGSEVVGYQFVPNGNGGEELTCNPAM